MSGPPPGVIPSGVIPSGVIPSGVIPSGVIPSGVNVSGADRSSGNAASFFAASRNTTLPPASQTHVPEILAGSIVPLVIGTLFVFARLVAKRLGKSWGWDDTLIMISWALVFPSGVLSCVQTDFGGGHHIAYVSFQSAIVSLKFAFAQKILYRLGLSVTKLSICFSYLRFFTDRTSRYWSYAMATVICLYTLPLLFTAIFECIPVANSWNPLKLRECRSADGGTIATAVLNCVMDLLMVVFAVPRMMRLKMNKSRKIALLLIANLGLLVVVAGVVRCVYWFRTIRGGDFSYHAGGVTTWSTIELNTGLVCACAPYLRLLVSKLRSQKPQTSFQTMSSNSNRQPGPKNWVDSKESSLASTYLATNDSFADDSLELMEKAHHSRTVRDSSLDLTLNSSRDWRPGYF